VGRKPGERKIAGERYPKLGVVNYAQVQFDPEVLSKEHLPICYGTSHL
jgi:hypothetical protein